jgi:hypothetical protein
MALSKRPALNISLPLFAVIGFGAWLRRSGLLTEPAQTFLSRFVYLYCLPIMIFLGIASKDFAALLNWPVIISSLLASLVVTALAWGLAVRLPRRVRGPVATGVYLSNLSYLGFPLAYSAFGEQGLVYAGVMNAFTMPVFVVAGVALLAAGQAEKPSLRSQLKTALLNPIIGATFLGLAAALILHEGGLLAWAQDVRPVLAVSEIVIHSFRLIGDMGMTLSLLAVGAALHAEHIRNRLGLMLLTSAGKLLAAPLLTLLACRWLFPGMERAAVGTAVLLMACPLSVGLYVISKQMDTDSDFIAGVLVLSTAGAVLTTPLWLLLVL